MSTSLGSANASALAAASASFDTSMGTARRSCTWMAKRTRRLSHCADLWLAATSAPVPTGERRGRLVHRRPGSAEDLLPGCGPGEEVRMTETPPAKTTVTFQDIEVTATKDRLWHVEAAGRSASAEFLDQAIDLVLPRLSYEDQDTLLIRLLSVRATEHSR